MENEEQKKEFTPNMEDTSVSQPVEEPLTSHQETVTEHHSDFDLTLIVIFLGIFGIGAFVYFATFDTFVADRTVGTEEIEVQEETEIIPDIYTGADDPTYVQGRELDILGLSISGSSKYFYVPQTKKTLYTKDVNRTCDTACQQEWEPYVMHKEVLEENGPLGTIYNDSVQDNQYTWNGLPLYTYNDDTKLGSKLGDGDREGMFRVARP